MSTVVRILYVEGDPAAAGLTADRLEDRDDGFETVSARGSGEATDQLSTARFDCVVTGPDTSRQTEARLLETVGDDHPDVPIVHHDGADDGRSVGGASSGRTTGRSRSDDGHNGYGLLATRVRDAVERHRGARRLDAHERVSDVVRAVESEVDRGDPRDEVERQLCETLVEADAYEAAHLADVDPGTTRVESQASAGEGTAPWTDPEADDGASPEPTTVVERAIRERSVAVSGVDGSARESPVDGSRRSLAVVPLEYESTLHGLLAVVTDRPAAFDATERRLLSGLAADVAGAVHAATGPTRRRFEAILDSPDSLIGILAPDGTLLRANQTAVEMVDASHVELTGQLFCETPWWAHSEDLQRRLCEWVEQAAGGEHVRFEATHPTADGDEVAVDGVLRPVTDSSGDVVSIIAEARDVSDLRATEQELVRQGTRLRQLNRINETLRSVHRELVGATDRDALETAICESLTGTDVYDGAWIGQYGSDTDRIRPTAWVGIDDDHMRSLDVRADDTPEGNGPAGRAVRTRTVQSVRDVAAADQTRPWRDQLLSLGIRSIAAIPIRHDDTVYGIIGVYANRANVFGDDERAALAELGTAIGNAFDSIETRRALERQNERLDKFAGVVSHDLRNPLEVARSGLELARRECDSEHLDTVDDALDRSEALIDDFLTLSREGKTVDQVGVVDLAGLATDCWDGVETTEATVVTEVDRPVRADGDRLRQLLENLFRNAVEHGGPEVTVTVGETTGGFYVADDGDGISPERRDDVFESGYSTASDGTGFGLSIVKDVVEAHDWAIDVTESEDGGARFEITGVEFAGER